MLLMHGTSGKSYFVDAIALSKDDQQILLARGIAPGAQLKILQHRPSGCLIIRCQTSRFALGRYYTAGIHVHPLQGGQRI